MQWIIQTKEGNKSIPNEAMHQRKVLDDDYYPTAGVVIIL